MTQDISTPAGRRAAWRQMLLGDHGVVRMLYRNFFRVAPGVYRSNQPAPHQVRQAARAGIRTIVNLRGATPTGFYLLEKEAAEAAGVALVDFVIRSRELPDAATLRNVRRLFGEIDPPVLFHCKSGADRVGFMSALYLIMHEGRSAEEARGQLHWRYGHYRVAKTGVLDAFFDTYIAYRDETGGSLDDWIDGPYDPDAIRDSFRAGRLQSFIVDRVLRRE
jgi:protein tyrosine/serine phosphatase